MRRSIRGSAAHHHVRPRTLSKGFREGNLPGVIAGRTILLDDADVEVFLGRKTEPAPPPISKHRLPARAQRALVRALAREVGR